MSAYFVFHICIHDQEKIQEYYPKADAALAPYNYQVLVFDDNSEVLEGNMNLPRTVVVKFDSREEALSWYNSAAYQEARAVRMTACDSYAVLVNGLE